jgi:ribosomal protein S18 acetylase RimI-like enzyme
MHEYEIDTAARIEFRDTVGDDDPARVGRLVEETGFFSDEERQIAIELVDERLAKGAASGYEFVFAERSGQLVGYTCHGRIAGTRSSHDLYWIAVHPRLQRRGLGRELIVRSERAIAAAGGTRIYVDTSSRAQYAPTRAFYERAGYTRAALIEDYYAPGDGLVIFQKVLR